MAKKLNLGVTLYSFNIDFYQYKKTFEEIVAQVCTLGPNQGIEVVGPQMDRAYPRVSPEFEARFKNAREKYGFIPVCYGGYPDPQRYQKRYASQWEDIEYLKGQIDAAATLECSNIRLGFDLDLADYIIPYAEKRKVCVGCEIHAPFSIEMAGALVDKIKKVNSPYFGIVPDCGAFCHTPSDVYIQRFAEQGVKKEVSDMIVKMWHEKKNTEEIVEATKEITNDPISELMAIEANNYFGHSDPKVMVPIMKYIHHLHGKFFNVNDSGEEVAVRVPEVVDALCTGGFEGYISCEFEGHHWFSDKDAFEQIKRYQTLVNKCCEKYN